MTWNPLDNDPGDKVLIGGRRTPGLAEIVGASSPRKWEESAGPGWSGGILLFRGIALSHFSVRCTLYTSEDWADWHKFRPLVMRPPIGRMPRALDIAHAVLADLGIFACQIEDVRAPEQVDHGVWMIELMLIEYRKLKAGTGTIDGAEATPVDPWDQVIERLSAKFDREASDGLANGGNQ